MFLSRCHLFLEYAKWTVLAAVSLLIMLREKFADTYMPASYGDFEVERGDIAPGTWINEFHATLLKPLVFFKKCVNPKKRAEGIREFCSKL